MNPHETLPEESDIDPVLSTSQSMALEKAGAEKVSMTDLVERLGRTAGLTVEFSTQHSSDTEGVYMVTDKEGQYYGSIAVEDRGDENVYAHPIRVMFEYADEERSEPDYLILTTDGTNADTVLGHGFDYLRQLEERRNKRAAEARTEDEKHAASRGITYEHLQGIKENHYRTEDFRGTLDPNADNKFQKLWEDFFDETRGMATYSVDEERVFLEGLTEEQREIFKKIKASWQYDIDHDPSYRKR